MRTRQYKIAHQKAGIPIALTPTNELIQKIENSSSPNVLHDMDLSGEESLSHLLNALLEQKGLKKAQVIRDARLNSTFGYQIFSGQRQASRNKVLALAFAMQLSTKEAQHLLRSADAGNLYAKNKRDAIIIYCLSHGYTLEQADEELYSLGLDTITEE